MPLDVDRLTRRAKHWQIGIIEMNSDQARGCRGPVCFYGASTFARYAAAGGPNQVVSASRKPLLARVSHPCNMPVRSHQHSFRRLNLADDWQFPLAVVVGIDDSRRDPPRARCRSRSPHQN